MISPEIYRWILLLPAFFLAWINLQSFLPMTRLTMGVLIPSMGICILLISTYFASLFTHQLESALWISSAACLLFAGGIFVWKRPPITKTHLEINSISLVYALLGLLLSILVAKVIFGFMFHDQMPIQGHLALVESILRGNLPPHLQVFPEMSLKYHFGSDLLGAIFAYVLRLPAYLAIDLTQILGWLLWIGALYLFAYEVKLPRLFTLPLLLWTCLGAGWTYLLKPWLGSTHLSYAWPHSYIIFGRILNPGTISNFFMQPYSVGIGLFFTYLALFSMAIKRQTRALWIFCALVLGTLAFVQITFFATLTWVTVQTLILIAYFEKDNRLKTIQAMFILLAIALPLALAFGGFLRLSSGYSPGLVEFQWPPGFLRNLSISNRQPLPWLQSLLWYLCTFGSLVFLAPLFLGLGFFSLKRRFDPILAFVCLYALQSFLIPQFFQYKLTWDIIKWFTSFHLTIPFVIVLLWSRMPRKVWRDALLVGLILLDIVPSFRFLWDLGFRSPPQVHASYHRWWKTAAPGKSPELEKLFNLLRSKPWNELLLSDPAFSEKIARYTGQAIAQIDKNTELFGVILERLKKRQEQITELTQAFNINTLRESGIRWIVYSCQGFEKNMSQPSQALIADAVSSGSLTDLSFREANTCLKIFHLETP